MENVKTISGTLIVSAKADVDGELELELPNHGETIWLDKAEALELAEHIQKVFSSDNH